MQRPSIYAMLAAFSLALVADPRAQQELSPEEMLGRGLHQEQVEGNCAAAIGSYKAAAERPGVGQATAARAVLQLAGCYEKLGRPEARATYERVLQIAPAGSPTYAAARAKVAARQTTDPLVGRNIDAYFEDAERVTAAPDGRFVAYTRPKPGRATLVLGERTPISALYVRDLVGGRERVLFDPGDAPELIDRVLWSPDGTSVAFRVRLDSAAHPVADGWAFDLRVATLDTGQVRTIVREQGRSWVIQWAPDSKAIAFDAPKALAETRDLKLWERASNNVRIISQLPKDPAESIAWSPDSQRVAHLGFADEDGKLVLVSVKSSARSVLPAPPPPERARVRLGVWHSGGIAITHQMPQVGNDFYLVPADGGAFRKICEGRGASGGDGCRAFTASDDFIVVRRNVNEGGRAYLRDLATGSERALTDATVVEQPILLPGRDGRLIAFKSDRDGDFGIYVAPVDQLPVRNPVRIATLNAPTSSAAGWWTPDGLVLNISDFASNIYRVDVDPKSGNPLGPPRRLTNNTIDNRASSVSPDGKQIAYRVRDRKHGIAIMDANGSNERLLLTVPPDLLLSVGEIGWRSPGQLLLHTARSTGPAKFSTLNPTTGARQVLPVGDWHGASLQYVAATDEVFYWTLNNPPDFEGGEVRARSLKTGSDRLVVRTHEHSQFYLVSPDGSRVFYTTANDNVPDGQPVAASLRMISLATGEDKMLASYTDSKGAWNLVPAASHGKFLVYQDPDKIQRIMNVETRQSWPLLTEPLNGNDTPSPWGKSWSPDGSYILLDIESERSERRRWTGLTYELVTKMMKAR